MYEFDGFNTQFFKICWPLIGEEVSQAITDFFENGKLLSQIKHTFLALISKADNPSTPADFKLISLTNELYKNSYHYTIIAHIITSRMKQVMRKIIG